MITGIDRGTGFISMTSGFIAGLLLLAILFIVVFEIIMRKFFNAPTSWSIELVTFIMVWFGFLTLPACQKLGRHVHVDIIISRFDKKTAVLWKSILLLFTLFFTLLLVYYSWEEFWYAFTSGETSTSIWSPVLWPVKLALPFGGFLFCIQLSADLVANLYSIVTKSWETDSSYKDNQSSNKPFIAALIVFIVSLALSMGLLFYFQLIGVVLTLLILLFAGVPIFATLGLLGMGGLYLHFGGSLALHQIPGIVHHTMGNFILAALPLFILAGFLLEKSGAGSELYELFSKLFGGLPGGLGMATVLSCAFFAAVSISSVATLATMTLIALPELKKRKYGDPFIYGLLGSGSTLGIMIPPSGTMILFAAVTDESLGKLMIAGILPGFMLVCLFLVYSFVYALRTGAYTKREDLDLSWNTKFQALGKAVWVLLVPLIIILGIFSGVFTVIESGAVAALYTILMVIFRKKIRIRELPSVLSECGLNAGFIFIIIAGALILGRFITLIRVPQMAMSFITDMNLMPGMVILAVMCLLTLLGLFLEVASVMLITLPVLYPVIIGMGMDGIWFAVMMTLAMEIAIITPPVGLNLYVIQGITQSKLSPIVRGMIPFYLIMVLGLVILYFFPWLSTFLPDFIN